jgi:hypothetical protein
MPARAWAEFWDVYYRPHLLVVNLGTPTDSALGTKLVGLLRRLVESLRSTADYAIQLEEDAVKLVFESESDADIMRGLLKIRTVERGGDDWASKSISDFRSP